MTRLARVMAAAKWSRAVPSGSTVIRRSRLTASSIHRGSSGSMSGCGWCRRDSSGKLQEARYKLIKRWTMGSPLFDFTTLFVGKVVPKGMASLIRVVNVGLTFANLARLLATIDLLPCFVDGSSHRLSEERALKRTDSWRFWRGGSAAAKFANLTSVQYEDTG
jgi:hypothetical protein